MSLTRQILIHNLGHKSSFTVTIITRESLHANPVTRVRTHTHIYIIRIYDKKLVIIINKIRTYNKNRKDVATTNDNNSRTSFFWVAKGVLPPTLINIMQKVYEIRELHRE